ncbi:hypothetical protein BMR1_02g02100 [Babesia microti strain RI]|uniref:CBF1-interacting co-repressor CIR N-terminal domain-containing protein n=1 Tax=Babesia microti (strain RI) TaxID=1133968 RepID=I7I8S1_BABMR|nr:hypothetical protein BMR1_02g02100 [Babesia microti strain RI]CCF73578.1 hypothetical protein BMR1_02g02100 [Babesia microti strain RI]|eukprot:XP_012648187.1 hypothetical protein BMR1_02g02100 [Babesia microti strain RI]
MGGHGGLNILPQKEWNVYRVDRQFQVKYDYHRKVESELADKEKRRKKRYNDTLVKLKRDRLRSNSRSLSNERQSRSANTSDSAVSCVNSANDAIKLAVKRHMQHSYTRRYRPKDEPSDESTDDEMKRLKGDDLDDLKRMKYHLTDKKKSSGEQITPIDTEANDETRNGIVPFRLFEKEERRDMRRQKEQREQLIKASCYVYNGSGRNAKQINIYTDTTEEGKQNLVSDFKQFAEAPKPWYSKRCDWYQSKSNDSCNGSTKSDRFSTFKSKFDVNSVDLKDNLLMERLEREAKERERAQQLKMKKGILYP